MSDKTYKYSDINFKDYFTKNKKFDIDIKNIKDETILSIFNDKETLLKWMILINKNVNDFSSQIEYLNTKLNNTINDLSETQNELENVKLEIIPPIGSIILFNDNSFNPNNKWVGTQWQLLNEGCFLRSVASDSEELATYRAEELPRVYAEFGKQSLLGGSIDQNSTYNKGHVHFVSGKSNNNNNLLTSQKYNSNNNIHIVIDSSKKYDKSNIATNDPVYKKNGKVLPYNYGVLMWKRVA